MPDMVHARRAIDEDGNDGAGDVLLGVVENKVGLPVWGDKDGDASGATSAGAEGRDAADEQDGWDASQHVYVGISYHLHLAIHRSTN